MFIVYAHFPNKQKKLFTLMILYKCQYNETFFCYSSSSNFYYSDFPLDLIKLFHYNAY